MDLVFRKLGNSTGITFPAAFLREHHFAEGQVVTVESLDDGALVLRAKTKRPRYTAAELNAQCDFNAPLPDDLLSWENAPTIGSEIL